MFHSTCDASIHTNKNRNMNASDNTTAHSKEKLFFGYIFANPNLNCFCSDDNSNSSANRNLIAFFQALFGYCTMGCIWDCCRMLYTWLVVPTNDLCNFLRLYCVFGIIYYFIGFWIALPFMQLHLTFTVKMDFFVVRFIDTNIIKTSKHQNGVAQIHHHIYLSKIDIMLITY